MSIKVKLVGGPAHGKVVTVESLRSIQMSYSPDLDVKFRPPHPDTVAKAARIAQYGFPSRHNSLDSTHRADFVPPTVERRQ